MDSEVLQLKDSQRFLLPLEVSRWVSTVFQVPSILVPLTDVTVNCKKIDDRWQERVAGGESRLQRTRPGFSGLVPAQRRLEQLQLGIHVFRVLDGLCDFLNEQLTELPAQPMYFDTKCAC